VGPLGVAQVSATRFKGDPALRDFNEILGVEEREIPT
jgi:hypothetical protein